MSGTDLDPAPARLAAFQRLGLPDTARGPAFAHLVAVLRQLTGAATVTLALVDDTDAWCTVGVAPIAPVPVASSPAAAALTHSAAVWDRVLDGPALDDHPAIAPLARPVTVTTVRVTDPDGTPVGALELAWPAGAEPVQLSSAVLQRFAGHVSELLELHAEADEYRRAVELAPDPMVVLNRDGMIVRVNPAFAGFVGSATHDLLGRPFLDLVTREDRARATSAVTRALIAPHRTTRMDLTLNGADGAVLPCAVSAGHLGGARRHVQLVVHDLAERLRVEEEHSRLSEQLARAGRLDAVGQVAAGLAHDLNNLLVVMRSNLELAEESLIVASGAAPEGSLDTLAEDLSELRGVLDRAGDMTGTMLAFGARTGSEEGVADVGEVVEAMARFVRRSLPSTVVLTTVVDDGLPLVHGDARELERAVMNLVINARDAVDGEGTITVTARLVGTDTVLPQVELTVADDGVGMDATTQVRLFEPLFTTKGQAGSGLGMPTVATFVEAIDGRIEVASTRGEGTTITLLLPVAEDDANRTIPVGVDVPVAGQPVLLVDPGERTRRVIGRMLSAAGYRVTAVPMVSDARAALAERDFALIVTELALLDGRGDRLVTQARETHPGLRAVILSSSDAPERLGSVPVLVKPFSHARLLRAVEQALTEG